MIGLPPGWVEATLAALGVEAQSGFPSGRHNAEGRGVPHLRPMNVDRLGRIDLEAVKYVEDERDRRLVPGDVLFNNTNSPALIGKTAYFDRLGHYAFSNHMTRLRPPAGLDPKFLAIQLHAMWMRGFFQRLCSHHVNQASVASARLLSEVSIALPPLNEQGRIVAAIEEHLSRLDAADALLAQADTRVEAFTRRTVAGAIEGHPTVELGQVTTHHRYGTSVKCLEHADGPPVLRIPNIRGRSVDPTDLKFATSAELGDCFVEVGDLLLIRTNGSRDLIGRVGVVDGAAGMAFASYLIRARPTAALDPKWAALALSSPRLRLEIESRAASTAGQYNLNLKALRSLRVPLPPLDEQRRIVGRVEEQLSAINALRAAIARAHRRSASLRRAVLERAFHGELVPQDTSDEPASTLLERIRAERATTPAQPRRRRLNA
jgi:type I restriction enzyme S subunit